MIQQPFETEFGRAWDTPGPTRYQLPDIDINQVLAARDTIGTPLTFRRSMLWERRRARPPTPVSTSGCGAGSDRSWNGHAGDGGEYPDRRSMPRLWLRSEQYQLILERAFLNHG